jgi:type I restriction enzyme R subunit
MRSTARDSGARLEDGSSFDPRVLPEEYLTNPREAHTFIYVSTIQRMAINLLGKDADGGFEYDTEADRLDIPINAFDVIIADECHGDTRPKKPAAGNMSWTTSTP